MAHGKELIRLALFGQPVKSSLSPAIHGLFAGQFGVDIDYQLIECDADGFPQALENFRLEGGAGCNITLPLKQEAWRLAAQASAEVSQAQAANTLVYQPSSGWFAHTTDGAGLMADLVDNNGIRLAGQRILILGAGGAAAGILGCLLAEEPEQIVLVNRNLARARTLSERFDPTGNIVVTNWFELSSQGAFDLVINATSLGHQGQAPALAAGLFGEDAICYDLNYFKASQPLKKRCGELQIDYIDGLGMLVEQAAKSFFLWTGKQPDTNVVIKICRRKLI